MTESISEDRRGLAPCGVLLPRHQLGAMVRCVRHIFHVQGLKSYRQLVDASLPEVARFDPGHDAVMMGYDFHLTDDGPRLIEVNTNAGGGLFAYRAHFPGFPAGPHFSAHHFQAQSRHQRRMLSSFEEEMNLFSQGREPLPRMVAIMDDAPEKQFLYGEMEALKGLFWHDGVRSVVVDPSRLKMGAEGVWHRDNRVDMVYNRHCDFYLETPELAGLREAYLARKVCLSPNPRAYGLLGDKRRLIIWSDAGQLKSLGVADKVIAELTEVVPESRLLADFEPDQLWAERRQWVLKPVTSHGSRGVLLGGKMTRKRYKTLPPEETLVQRLVPPSLTPCPESGREMKTDLRLYVYRNQVLGVAARLYQGQVTNFREPGNGFAPVRVV
ncbi:MAG: hypothetical protein HQL52_13030 [Magnetococcales bacterium]|nr:hypothetical protein [Magnetococcales bacterium]